MYNTTAAVVKYIQTVIYRHLRLRRDFTQGKLVPEELMKAHLRLQVIARLWKVLPIESQTIK